MQHCERMLDETLPLPERKYGFAGDETFKEVWSKCREMVRLELWRVRFALEAKDIHAAQQALQRIDRITDFLQQDYSLSTGLAWLSIEKLRPLALSRILASGLAGEQWLLSQEAWLLEKESRISDAHRRMILSEAVTMLGVIDIQLERMERRSRARFLTIPEAWLFLGREGAVLAKDYCISDFADFPEKPAGILAGMLAAALRQMGTRKIPELVAALRISRGMVAAELARLRTGRYPETLDNPPMDPFSGKPLKYTVGKTMVAEWLFMPDEDDTPLKMTPDLQKQLGWTDEWCAILSRPNKGKYTFKKEWRNVAAVQFWSVGPDCVDDGGVRLPKNLGGKANDDLRFMIRLDTEHP